MMMMMMMIIIIITIIIIIIIIIITIFWKLYIVNILEVWNLDWEDLQQYSNLSRHHEE